MNKLDNNIELPLRSNISDTRSSLYYAQPEYRQSEIIKDNFSFLDRLEIKYKDSISNYYMIFSALCMSLNALFVRLCADLPLFELTFLRSIITFALLWVYIWGFNPNLTIANAENKRHIHILSLMGFVVAITYVYGIFNLDLAEAITVLFAAPMWIGILSWFVFGQAFRPDENKFVIIIVVGICLIWRPFSTSTDDTSRFFGTIVCVIHSFFHASTNTVVKVMQSRVDPVVIMIMATIVNLVLSGVGSLIFTWTWPETYQWVHLIVMSFLYFSGQFFLMKSIQTSDRSNNNTIALNYVQLPFAYIFDIFALGNFPSIWSVGGTVLVLLGSVIIIRIR